MDAARPYSRDSYPSYNPEAYNPEGWGWRKVTAIPQALFSAVIKTTYHLAQSAIYSFFVPRAEREYSCYHILAKDFEEAWGWIVTLFNDESGFYHIQRSQSSEMINFRAPQVVSQGAAARSSGEAERSSEADRTSTDELKRLLNDVNQECSESPDWYGHIAAYSPQLCKITVEQLKKIDLSDFPKIPLACFFPEGSELIKERFQAVSPKRVTEDFIKGIFSRRLYSLISGEQLEALIVASEQERFRGDLEPDRFFPNDVEGKMRFKELPLDLVQRLLRYGPSSYLLQVLDQENLEKLDFSNLTSHICNCIFCEQEDSCFGRLSLAQKLIIKGLYDKAFCTLPIELLIIVPPEELKYFELRDYSKYSLENLFPNDQAGIERFRNISGGQLSEVLPELPVYLFPHVSEQQIRDLKVSRDNMSSHIVSNLFPDTVEGKRCFSAVLPGEERDKIPSFFIPKYLSSYEKATSNEVESL